MLMLNQIDIHICPAAALRGFAGPRVNTDDRTGLRLVKAVRMTSGRSALATRSTS